MAREGDRSRRGAEGASGACIGTGEGDRSRERRLEMGTTAGSCWGRGGGVECTRQDRRGDRSRCAAGLLGQGASGLCVDYRGQGKKIGVGVAAGLHRTGGDD